MKNNNFARSWRQQQRRQMEQNAIRAMEYTLWALVVGMMIVFSLTGCGQNNDDPVLTWNVTVDAADMTAQTRTWEICGGTVMETYEVHEALPDKQFGMFIGAATAGQAACYAQYGVYTSMTQTERHS